MIDLDDFQRRVDAYFQCGQRSEPGGRIILDMMRALRKSYDDRARANTALIEAGYLHGKLRQENEELRAALSGMLFHFGNPKRDEWLNDEAFRLAKEADAFARAALADQGKERGELCGSGGGGGWPPQAEGSGDPGPVIWDQQSNRTLADQGKG